MMKERGFHTERVAASGRRKGAVCDAVLFTLNKTYLVEVKSTREKSFSLRRGLHGLLPVCSKFNVLPLIAVYFKSSHSSRGKGRWVLKVINENMEKVSINDGCDEL
jgi:Holliday junction resolvase